MENNIFHILYNSLPEEDPMLLVRIMQDITRQIEKDQEFKRSKQHEERVCTACNGMGTL